MNADAMPGRAPIRWYRERWPWFLMLGPAVVVVAGLFTAWLAVTSDDGVVAADYYKRGLLINRDIEKAARGAGVGAVVTFASGGTVHARLSGVAGVPASPGDAVAPAVLTLRLVHPTRAGLDAVATLRAMPDGTYEGTLPEIAPGRWLVSIEGDAWRLPTVEVTAPTAEVRLGATAPR